MIRVLPPDVAAKIAAGEVVERPASVVKELVENALDAGASTVSIELEEGGRRLIRISDNGHGIATDEVPLAFERHATSKLQTLDDLDHIHSLGFRGEALASISSVSQMTLVTRPDDEQAGVRATLENGEIIQIEPAASPRGTMITVENLFYNVPARLKFLKKTTTERGAISALITRYAMAYPGVRFQLTHGKQELLRTNGSGNLHTVISEVYGVEVASQMIEVSLEGGALRPDLHPVGVYGYTSQPALNRANRSHITLFVNGRWVQDSSLTHAVVQAYHTMMVGGRYPVAILMITVPPEQVDVNVHPAKTQVRFRQQGAVFSTIQRAVRRVLIDQAELPTVRDDIIWGSPDWQARRDRLAQVTSSRMNQMGIDLDLDDPGQYRKQTAEQSDEPNEPPRRKRKIPVMRVVGQVGDSYVITEGPSGIYLIDQNAAHQRVLFERFLAERQHEEPASQELMEPVVVELLAEQIAAFEEQAEEVVGLGFSVEVFGHNTLRIRALPALLADSDPVDALMAILGQIEGEASPSIETRQERLAARMCREAAVRIGQTLSFAEMQALLRQLEECEAPQTDPYGHPTMIHISAEQLAREFGRASRLDESQTG